MRLWQHKGYLWLWHKTLEVAQQNQRAQMEWSQAYAEARKEMLATPTPGGWPECQRCGLPQSTRFSPVDGKKFCNCHGQGRR